MIFDYLTAAQRIGLTDGQLNQHSNHSPSVHTLQKFAKAVGCRLKIELIPHSTR